jgi:predicted HicB family RNase H-like nuclease
VENTNQVAEPERAPAEANFRLRIPWNVHQELKAVSSETGLSLNELYIFAAEELARRARGNVQQVGTEAFRRRAERRNGG